MPQFLLFPQLIKGLGLKLINSMKATCSTFLPSITFLTFVYKLNKWTWFYLGVIWVIETGTELIWVLVGVSDDLFLDDERPPVSWEKPGGNNSFSFSLVFFESMRTTWLIVGLLLAVPCVQKKAILIYLMTSSSGNPSNSGSTISKSWPSS